MATVTEKADCIDAQADSSRPKKVPLRVITLAVLTAIFVALSVLIAIPFLSAITWGVALAIMGWPMHRLIRARIASPSLAAVMSTAIVALVIVLPITFVIYQISRETMALANDSPIAPKQIEVRTALEQLPVVDRMVAWMDQINIDVETEARRVFTGFLPAAQGIAQGSIAAMIQFLVAIFILFYIFRDRGEFMQDLRELLPLTRGESDRVFTSAADSVYANLYATVMTSLFNSITFGFLFWLLGVRAAILWAAVMFVLSILPIVGAAMVWLPVALYFAFTGQWGSALPLLGWGTFTAICVDYILYARLAGRGMRMHPVPALIAFLGGLAIFGLSGVILGPAIVAITSAVIDLWRERNQGMGSALSDAV